MNSTKSYKKIIITQPYGKLGGVASFVENLKPFLTDDACFFYRGSNPKDKYILQKIGRQIILPFRFFYFLLINKSKVILINTSLSKSNLIRDGILIFISNLFLRKIILFIHGFQEQALKNKFLLKYGYFKSDVIIVLAENFKQQLEKSGCKTKIIRFYNPVSIELFNILLQEEKQIRKEFKNFLFLARVEENKGIFIALDAFAIVLKKFPDIVFNIAGDGTALEKVHEYVKRKKINNVNFFGFVAGRDKYNLLLKSDCMIFPSFYEGLPICILEAMVSGQIIITRPVGGIVDISNQLNIGFIIETLNPEDFAKAMIELISNAKAYSIIHEQNSKFAFKNFHPSEIAKELIKIAETLI